MTPYRLASWIFPVDAGVNLDSGASGEVYGDIPRGCGGEPQEKSKL